MEKATTILEGLLKECKNVRECFEVQNALVDGLTMEQELELRARYAGLTVEEARLYQDALKTVRFFENRKENEEKAKKLVVTVCNIIAN